MLLLYISNWWFYSLSSRSYSKYAKIVLNGWQTALALNFTNKISENEAWLILLIEENYKSMCSMKTIFFLWYKCGKFEKLQFIGNLKGAWRKIYCVNPMLTIKFTARAWVGHPATNSQKTKTSELSRLKGGTGSKLLCSSKQDLFLLWPALIPASIYMLKVNNRNARTRCEISLKLTIKTLEHNKYSRDLLSYSQLLN